MLNHNSVMLLKAEATYNTDSVPTGAANALLVENLNWSFANARMVDRPAVRTSKGMLAPIYAGTLIQVSFDVEMKGSGAAGTAPEIGAALIACGMSETVVASTSVTYKPASSSIGSCTIYFHRDGKLFKVTGARGDVSFSITNGGYAKASFTFTGHLVSETDAAVPTPTYDSTLPVAAIGLSSFAVDSTTFALTKLDFALGNQIATPDDIVGSDGFGEIQITGRNVTGSVDPEDELVAAYNFVNKWQTGASVAINTGAIGASAGNILTASLPAVTFTEMSPGDKSGIATRELGFRAAESSTDDEVSLAFT